MVVQRAEPSSPDSERATLARICGAGVVALLAAEWFLGRALDLLS